MLFLWIRPLVKCCSWHNGSQVQPNTKVHFWSFEHKGHVFVTKNFSILLYYFMSNCFLWTSKMGTLHTTYWVGMLKHLSSHATSIKHIHGALLYIPLIYFDCSMYCGGLWSKSCYRLHHKALWRKFLLYLEGTSLSLNIPFRKEEGSLCILINIRSPNLKE